jgi:hypothetical protein
MNMVLQFWLNEWYLGFSSLTFKSKKGSAGRKRILLRLNLLYTRSFHNELKEALIAAKKDGVQL